MYKRQVHNVVRIAVPEKVRIINFVTSISADQAGREIRDLAPGKNLAKKTHELSFFWKIS